MTADRAAVREALGLLRDVEERARTARVALERRLYGSAAEDDPGVERLDEPRPNDATEGT
jgi:hypothetical protein